MKMFYFGGLSVRDTKVPESGLSTFVLDMAVAGVRLKR